MTTLLLPSKTAPINQNFLNELIKHHLLVLSLSEVLRDDAHRVLDSTEELIAERLVREPAPSPQARARKARDLFAFVRTIRKDAWRQIVVLWRQKLRDMMKQEPRDTAEVADRVLPVQISLAFPLASTLSSILATEPYLGRTFNEWMRNVEAADLGRIREAITIGAFRGENGRQIAIRVLGRRRVRGRDGATQQARNNAAALAKTSTEAAVNLSRREFYKSNRKVFTGELYVATLDNRTTEICTSLNGRTFEVGEGPYPPVHFNCRSLRVGELDPEIIGRSPLKQDMEGKLLREFATKRGLRSINERSDLPRGTRRLFDQFVKRRLRELTGKL